jgi:hypothetical protein
MVGTQLAGLFASGRVRTEDGEERRLGSALDPIEGRHLYDLVRLNGVTRTLEVGMANGVSTLYLAQGVRDNLGALGTEGAGAGALATSRSTPSSGASGAGPPS